MTPKQPRRTAHELVSVYKAINATTREIYVGLTRISLDRLAREHGESRPYPIAHWKCRHGVSYHYLEYAIAENLARNFIRRHVRSARKPGWTFITDETSRSG
ncbi:MAG: hypothetical protein HY553_01790 [Elusimicrobia bacterium]|nr:hypothetical protein [Elusimicrobiota bacterium]